MTVGTVVVVPILSPRKIPSSPRIQHLINITRTLANLLSAAEATPTTKTQMTTIPDIFHPHEHAHILVTLPPVPLTHHSPLTSRIHVRAHPVQLEDANMFPVKLKALLLRVLAHSNVIFVTPSTRPGATSLNHIHLTVLFAHVLVISNVTFDYVFRNLMPLMTQWLIKLYELVPLSLTVNCSTIVPPFHPLSNPPMLHTPHS